MPVEEGRAAEHRRWSGWGSVAALIGFSALVAACSLAGAGDGGADGDGAVVDGSIGVGSSPTVQEPGRDGGVEAVSFARDIAPIMSNSCASCHTGNGPGTQHLRFDTAGNVSSASFAVAAVVERRFMPPWPAGDDSVPFDHDWSLSDDEIAAIVSWDEAGAPLDVEPATPMVPANGVVGLAEPDTVIRADGSYDGTVGQPDEYRCFVYDPEVTEPSFVAAMEFVPEQTQVVHHAVGFRVRAADRAAADAQGGADGQGGWTCFGFSPGASADLVFTWAPGSNPMAYPEGTGLEMQPGDFFVMQTHYHFDVEADADRSTLAIDWARPADGDDQIDAVELQTYLAPAEIPCGDDEDGPLCDRDAAKRRAVAAYGRDGVLADLLVLACGNPLDEPDGFVDGVASSSCTLPVFNPGEIISVFGHQHELGASFRMTLNPGADDELVLLDIPRWDFDWQLIYEPVDEIVIERGDTVQVECTWDRALRDPELEPAYVLWADGTDDEMCFSTIVTRPA